MVLRLIDVLRYFLSILAYTVVQISDLCERQLRKRLTTQNFCLKPNQTLSQVWQMNKVMALVHLVQPRISAFRLGRPLRPTSSHALA